MNKSWFFVGLDLGQSQDFTAIAVVERAELVGEFDGAVWARRKEIAVRLRYLERVPLGTPYPEVVTRVARVIGAPQVAGCCHLAVDATGVGRPVVDMLRRERMPCRLLPAVITSGFHEGQVDGYYHVPKRDLISGLRVLLEQGQLQIAARLEHGKTLVDELAEMRVKVTTAGNEQYGAWREGSHDDLVLAVSMACWGMRKVYPRVLAGRGAYWSVPVECGL